MIVAIAKLLRSMGPAGDGSPHTGTTIIAVTYADGAALGADSRVSTGNYVSNRASDKLTPLNDSVWLLRSGSAADPQLVADYGTSFLILCLLAISFRIYEAALARLVIS